MSRNLKTLVIATTLTPESDAVVRTGAAIARTTGAEVWLVHACAPPAFPSEIGGADLAWTEIELRELRERLEEQARRTGLAELAGFSASRIHLGLGVPYREILEVARRSEADLIVLGAAEGGALRRVLLGSTADRVIRKASCPVLVLRPEAVFPPERVVIPVDLSTLSAGAIRKGLDLLARTGGKGAAVEILFVLNPLETEGSLQFTPAQIERFAATELHRFVREATPEGIAAERIRVGYPVDEILAEIGDSKADLAVLATHGLGGFERFLIGSVTAEVLRRAPCTIFVVPPPASLEDDVETRREKQAAAKGHPILSMIF